MRLCASGQVWHDDGEAHASFLIRLHSASAHSYCRCRQAGGFAYVPSCPLGPSSIGLRLATSCSFGGHYNKCGSAGYAEVLEPFRVSLLLAFGCVAAAKTAKGQKGHRRRPQSVEVSLQLIGNAIRETSMASDSRGSPVQGSAHRQSLGRLQTLEPLGLVASFVEKQAQPQP